MKYLSTYFISFTVALFSIATFNWFIDPFGMFWSPQIESINLMKPEAGKRSRITKAYQVHKIDPQILIVGNSRVEMGLDPKSKSFNGKIVYNQGIPGAGLAMQVDYAIDAIENNATIEQLVVGVDFLDFLLSEKQVENLKSFNKPVKKMSYDFRLQSKDHSNLASIERLKEKLMMIFSLDALSASVNTLFQQKSMQSSLNSHGFNNALSYISIMNSEGIKPLFTQKLSEISTRLTNKTWEIQTNKNMPYSPSFAYLGKLITIAKERNIPITFFINPYHFSYLHTLADEGQWDNFQLWKKVLVKYLSITLDNHFILWDFSGASDFVNEEVPLMTPKQPMQWFWEPAHYKKALGEILLSRIQKHDNSLHKKPANNVFGTRLTLGNIDHQLILNSQQLKSSATQWKNLRGAL